MTVTIRTPDPKHARHARPKRRRTRFSSMESLGFIESPATVTTSWLAPPTSAPPEIPLVAPRTKRGAHERTVADLEPNDTTEFLVRRNVRWGLLTVMVLLLGALTAGAVWLWQRPAIMADSALAAVESAAENLEPELMSLSDIASKLSAPGLDSTEFTDQTRSVDQQARELFNAAGALPSSAAESRTAAADTATSALDASRLIRDAVAYRSTAVQILVPPALETDPELIALDDAVRTFGTWQQNFNEIRSALPDGVMSQVTQELALIAGTLESIQGRYIDALRDDDPDGAAGALGDLADRLRAAEDLLWASLAEIEAKAGELINESLEDVRDLTG